MEHTSIMYMYEQNDELFQISLLFFLTLTFLRRNVFRDLSISFNFPQYPKKNKKEGLCEER